MSTQIADIAEFKAKKEAEKCNLCPKQQKITELEIALGQCGNALLAMMRIMNRS